MVDGKGEHVVLLLTSVFVADGRAEERARERERQSHWLKKERRDERALNVEFCVFSPSLSLSLSPSACESATLQGCRKVSTAAITAACLARREARWKLRAYQLCSEAQFELGKADNSQPPPAACRLPACLPDRQRACCAIKAVGSRSLDVAKSSALDCVT